MKPAKWKGRFLWLPGTGVLLVLGVGSLPAPALDPTKAITQYVHEVWRIEQGLPQNSVFAIRQTRDGYLWLGTLEGLVRFDGVRFVVFNTRNTPQLKNNAISSLAEDRGGGLWIGSDRGGLARLKDGKFTAFTTKDGLTSEVIGPIYEDRRGNLWFGTWGRGLNRFTDGKFTAFTTKDGLAGDHVWAIREDRDGNLWLGTPNGLSRLREGTFRTYTSKDGLSSDRIFSILEDRTGDLWVGTEGGGLNRLRSGNFTSFGKKDGLPSDTVLTLYEDRVGNLWIGTKHGGLARFRDGRFASFSTKEGLTDDRVTEICEDREGSLWLGTWGGLNRLRDGKFTTFSAQEGLSDEMAFSTFQGRDGDFWIGTMTRGVNRLRNGRVTTFRTTSGLSSDQIGSIAEDSKGSLWVGTRGVSLNRLKDDRFSAFRKQDALSTDYIHAVYGDREGNVWIGTGGQEGGGLFRFRDGTFTPVGTKDLLAGDGVDAIHEDRTGGLWVGTRGGGLNLFRDGTFTRFTTKDGLSSDQVVAIYEDAEADLWIGTQGGGLNLLRHGKFSSFTTKSGLFDDTVYQILEDGQGNLWMSCDKGVFRASKNDLTSFAEGRIQKISCVSYGATDGMKSAECNGTIQPAGWKTRDGRLWFPTTKGVVEIDPAHVLVNQIPPTVWVEEVLVDNKALDTGAVGSPIALPPGRERLDFRFTANSFVAPKRVRLRYRLDGFDKDWVDVGAERMAHYTHLPPRKYTFRVIAANDDGVWNETGASLVLSLAPHFYETKWFYLLCGIVTIGLTFSAHRVRVRQMRTRERQLLRLVEERTIDLRGANHKLLEAQEKISRLLASTPAASESISEWARSVAAEVASVIGAGAIGIWEIDREVITPVADSGASPPSREALEKLMSPGDQRSVATAEGVIVPITGMSGELCGALVVTGNDVAWGDTERRLLAGFAHQLGAALDLRRVRQQLAAAEERRAATLDEMHAKGVATLQVCSKCGRCYDHTVLRCEVDESKLDSPRPLPYRLLGRHRFLRILGQGGMGVVFLAHDEKLDRDVAVKLIRPDHWRNAATKRRFEREAHAVARIQHPSVVELYDSGELDDGTAFLVMERLSGCDLRLLTKTHGRGTPVQVASLVRQGCAGLRAAHRAGVVHRDVKPENVFFIDDPSGFRVKILDFGLAKSMAFEKGLTQTGAFLGTPSYMAPEQVQGEDVDARADVYAFAAVAYEALTGRQAVQGDDLGQVLVQVLNSVPPPVSSLVPDIPPAVDAAFESALAKNPARRLKDIELWGSSFVKILEKVEGDPATAGWPVSRDIFVHLRDSQMERGPTFDIPGMREP